MSKKIKLGILGLWRGMSFANIFKNLDDVTIHAVCDFNKETLNNALKSLPEGVLAFESYDELLDSGIEAVCLCNYFYEHAPFAIKALEKGIAVFSECTAASTLKECVDLCEAVERTNGKYFFAENYPFAASCLEMKRLYETGTLGKVCYAEGEYVHPTSNDEAAHLAPGKHHWRRYLPTTYYITHSLSPLMHMTGAMPLSVNARPCYVEGYAQKRRRYSSDMAGIMLITMDNDAIFRVTGCAGFAPHGNWYRLACTNGAVETIRGNQANVRLNYNSWAKPEGADNEKIYTPSWSSNAELAEKAGHGGGDFWVCYNFIEYLKGNREPDFDVYKACAMSACAIQSWYSILDNGANYPIPNFRNKADRAKYADDNRTPFYSDADNSCTLPCCSRPLPEEYIEDCMKD